MKNILFLIMIGIFTTLGLAKPPEWFNNLKKLQNFPSTQKNVEEFFNFPEIIYSTESEKKDKLWTKLIIYKLPEGELTVFYSAGRCSEKNTNGYDLDNGVVVSYSLHLSKTIKIEELKVNLKEYSAVRHDDIDIWDFRKREIGITYSLFSKKIVLGIDYSLPKKFYKTCKELSQS